MENETFAPQFNLSDAMRTAGEQYCYALARLNAVNEDTTRAEDDLLSDAYFTARQRLIECPAQNIDDLRVKIDVMWLDPNACPLREHINHVFRDLQRLSSQKASPVFQAGDWLEWFQRKGGGWIEQNGDVNFLYQRSDGIKDAMSELAASGACEMVKDLIRQTGRAA